MDLQVGIPWEMPERERKRHTRNRVVCRLFRPEYPADVLLAASEGSFYRRFSAGKAFASPTESTSTATHSSLAHAIRCPQTPG